MSLLVDRGLVVPVTDHPPVERAFFDEHPCELVSYHAPTPVMTEFHHSKPMYLQKRLWGEVRFGPDVYYCSNCHEAVHSWCYFLDGERREPKTIGRAAKAAGAAMFGWYMSERALLTA